jgi:hypothetical protein
MEQVPQFPPEQLLHEDEPEDVSLEESLLKPMGAKIFTIFLLPHFSHLISEPLFPLMTISETSWHSLHL